jgi:hypothetical protein
MTDPSLTPLPAAVIFDMDGVGTRLRFRPSSCIMNSVRILLALALVLYLSGVPAAVAAPCAGGSGPASDCCSRHRNESGGPVIGSCGCQAAAGASVPDSAVSSVRTGGSDRTDAPALAVLAPAIAYRAMPVSARVGQTPIPFDPSPPRLSGAGFRC